jgi:hypothetical protein
MRGALSSEATQNLCRRLPHIPFAIGFSRSGRSRTYPPTRWSCFPQGRWGPTTFPWCQKVGGLFRASSPARGRHSRPRTCLRKGCGREYQPLRWNQRLGGRDVCNAGQNLVGSHGGRRYAGVDGSLNSGFLYFSLPHARPVPRRGQPRSERIIRTTAKES